MNALPNPISSALHSTATGGSNTRIDFSLSANNAPGPGTYNTARMPSLNLSLKASDSLLDRMPVRGVGFAESMRPELFMNAQDGAMANLSRQITKDHLGPGVYEWSSTFGRRDRGMGMEQYCTREQREKGEKAYCGPFYGVVPVSKFHDSAARSERAQIKRKAARSTRLPNLTCSVARSS